MKRQKRKFDRRIFFRLIKEIRGFYPVLFPLTVACILFTAIVSALQALFLQRIIAIVEESWKSGDWSAASGQIITSVLILAGIYAASLLSAFVYNQMIAVMTQGVLKKFRTKMYNNMETLPIRYFDTNSHGDIMSTYTNDIDTLRQMISQSFPQILISAVTCISVFAVMLYFCAWLSLVVLAGVVIMLVITGKLGGNSSKYFMAQQKQLGKVEGYVEEMMNGQKVIKVFNHEKAAEEGFDKVNDELFRQSDKANKFANILGPVLNNIGNILYAVVAIVGGILLVTGVPNVSFSGLAMSISVVVPFLNMTKQFAGNINQVSHQVNSVVMGMAGTRRIFAVLDEKSESDDGYVTLVNAKLDKDMNVIECEEHTGLWAWKHPHSADGSITYTLLQGDVVLDRVDFGYTEQKQVLHDISVYARPGQKVAFVGATGAGKTTITNLINRFYDIADGKIRYDGININKIRKADLRKSLGIVLQDVNLFMGTVMENIRYGRLDATDEECIEAAKLAGAHDFITRLPEGYNTMLSGNGANLSQGQRQLLSISRAAVADPPVMIMDEATSSIDTRTEQIVQKGMDALMKGRTVFVIAHRLSTVKNSDVIIVLDHGRIIERGNHEQLIAQKGSYYQLYTGAFELE